MEPIKLSIKKALKFLETEQRRNGEFPTYFSINKSPENPTYVKSPFITTHIIHALQLENNQIAIKLRKRTINFLDNYKERDFTWKFFKDQDIPKGFIYNLIASDLDDTSCALICFIREEKKFDKKIIRKILNKQTTNGNKWGFSHLF